MAPPFSFASPHIPPVPQSTPVASSGPHTRPPLVNPYDKFSQTEFDDWISTITGSLRKVLGHESDELDRSTVQSDSASPFNEIHARPTHHSLTDEEDEEYDSELEGVNDSLADIRTRFVARLDKGKARDSMEGPGLAILAKGDRSAPIEIDLDEDESECDEGDSEAGPILPEGGILVDEDDLDDQEVAQHLSFIHPDEDEEEEAEEAEESDEDEPPDQWELPQSSLRSQANLDDDSDEREDEHDLDEAERASSSEEEERQGSDNVIEILSSEDEMETRVPTQEQKSVSEDEFSSSEGEGEGAQEDGDQDEGLSAEEEVDELSGELHYGTREGVSPAEDGGESEKEFSDNEELPEEDSGEVECFEDEEGVDKEGEGVDEEEDGDQVLEEMNDEYGRSGELSPEVINLDSDAEEDQLNDEGGEVDNFQPAEHDTSFPPHPSELPTQVEIRDPWFGPQTYAEDYYAGGPILPSPGRHTLPNPHVLGVNDDLEDFLTPGVVTPSESNEREASAGEDSHEQELHLPHLEFVHGATEMPPETRFVETESAGRSTEGNDVDNHVRSDTEVNMTSARDEEPISNVVCVEAQDGVQDTMIVDSSQQKEDVESQEPIDALITYEDQSEESGEPSQPTQDAVHDSEEAVRQAESAFDKIHEEMDAEVARESQRKSFPTPQPRNARLPCYAEDHRSWCEDSDVTPRPTHRKLPCVTVEEVTDEEATDKESNDEEEVVSSPPVLPLGTSDLDIEPVSDDGQPDIPFDDMSSPLAVEIQPTLADGGVEDSPTTAPEILADEAKGGEVQLSSNVMEVAAPELAEPVTTFIEDAPIVPMLGGPVTEQQASAPQSPALLPAEPLNAEVVVEPEQQQLPTPPAEQEVYSNRATVEHETQPAPAAEEAEGSMAAEEGITEQDSAATLTEQSPVVATIDVKEKSCVAATMDTEGELPPTGTIEKGLFYAPVAPAAESSIPQRADLGEALLDRLAEEQPMDSADMNMDIIGSASEFVPDVAIEEVTDDIVTVVDDSQVIIEEVLSKAPSEEPGFLDEQQEIGTLSKEGSVISLPVVDGFDLPHAPPYTVEELLDEGITDEDADGELDSDLGTSPIQHFMGASRLDDFTYELFDPNWLALGEPLIPPSKTQQATDEVVITSEQHSAKQAEPEAASPRLVDSQVTLAEESTTGSNEIPLRGATDEDDIASSREASPSPVASEKPVGSPSDSQRLADISLESAVTPCGSPSGSERELYGEQGASFEPKTLEATAPDQTGLIAKEATPDLDADDASASIPGLTLTTSLLRPSSPIPGLGARPPDDTALETVDGEIPGLTWSKMFSPSSYKTESPTSTVPQRSASFPQTTLASHSPSHMPFTMTRRVTEPVLFSDPYPYSLSTPGLDNTKDEAGDTDEEEEHELSISSSSTSISLEKDSEKEVGEPVPETNAEELSATVLPTQDDKLEREPNPSDAPQDLSKPMETIDVCLPGFGDVDQDRDADGDLDPDFIQLPENASGASEVGKAIGLTKEVPSSSDRAAEAQVREISLGTGISEQDSSRKAPDLRKENSHDPQQLMPSNDAIIDTGVEADARALNNLMVMPEAIGKGSDKEEADSRGQNNNQLDLQTQPGIARPNEVVPETATRASPDTRLSLSPDGDATPKKLQSNGKRKRSLSPESKINTQAISAGTNNAKASKPTQHLMPRQWQLQLQDRAKRPRNASTANGMGEDSDVCYQSSELSSPSDDEDSSDANAADRILRASSAESNSKAVIPAPVEPAGHFYPMLHKHGRGAMNQGKKEQAATMHSQRSIQKTHPAPSRTSSQRATRSNCRYRKISVPKEEDGPRVCFLVPGCSLGDEEVIEENEIEDLGEATFADSLRMIGDIESLDFDSYLIGVLRQLVGVDLLREQEVFYLPAPGEEPTVRKTQPKKTLSDKSTLSKKPSKSGNADTSALSTPRTSIKSPSPSKAPISNAGSTSTSISVTRNANKYELESITPISSPSHSGDEEGALDDTERKPPKPRPKYASKTEKGKTTPQSTMSGKNVKRNWRLPSDALAYRPQSDSEDDAFVDEKTIRISRKKPTASKGIKRRRSGRSFAAMEDLDGRETKKPKKDR